MSDKFGSSEDVFEPDFGVVCGEDIDAVLDGDEAAVRAWAIGVLSTALERVRTYGSEANELFDLAIEMLWQFSGGESGGCAESAIIRWLDAEHRRGRQWSKFVELVPAFVDRMNAMWASNAEKPQLKPISDDDLPF